MMRGNTNTFLGLVVALLWWGYSASPAYAGNSRRVLVEGERVTLGDIVRAAPAEVAALDLGPSPRPGKSMVLRRGQIIRRLKEAMVEARRFNIPLRTTVVRPRQVVSELALQRLVERELPQFLKGDVEVKAMRVRGGVVLPRGALSLWASQQTLRGGKQSVVAVVRAGEGKGRKIQVLVDAERESTGRAIVVKRGETVVIELRVNGVLVRAKGTAQQDGREGQNIAVLPRDGRRLLRGRVNGAGIVEVSL